MKRAADFFTAEERKRIEEATHAAEKKTSGEVAVMIVDESDSYLEAEVTGGVLIAGVISLALTATFFHSSAWSLVPLAFILFFPSKSMIKHIAVLKKAFTGITRMEEAVRIRAVTAFYEKGLYLTRDKTGVLFFMSLFEHRVWVLADKGIYEKIEQETLNEFAIRISEGIKSGRACDALCEAIHEAGVLLAEHFPILPGDINELSNDLLS